MSTTIVRTQGKLRRRYEDHTHRSLTTGSLRSGTREHTIALVSVSFILFFSALEAYAFSIVPLQWILYCICASIALYAATRMDTKYIGALWPLIAYFFYAVVVTAIHSYTGNYSLLMPDGSTTAYAAYIVLRCLTILSFIGGVLVGIESNKLLGDRVLRIAATVGFIISIVSIYIYFAQIYGLWEIPRTRLGTGGTAQSTVFSYAFHRAMGTFREPSHLAQWLIFPLFSSLAVNAPHIQKLLISIALLLTGSLSGLVPVLIAGSLVFMYFFFTASFSRNIKTCVFLCISFTGSVVLFESLASRQLAGDSSLLSTVVKRLEPVISDGGLANSNRNYIYEYVRASPVNFSGIGLGNSNIELSAYLSNRLIVSFLSLYYSTMYSLGWLGLILLAFALITPLFGITQVRRHCGLNSRRTVIYLAGALVAWLVVYSVHAEELQFSHAFLSGVLLATLRKFEGPRPEIKVRFRKLQKSGHA